MSMSTTQRPSWADLLDAAGPGRYRAGRADPEPVGEIALEALTDPAAVAGLIDEICARLVTQERSAAGFTLFYGAADALLTPAMAELLADAGELRVTDLAETRLTRGPDGFVETIRPRTVALGAPTCEGALAVGGWAATALDAIAGAFSPHLQIGRRAFAAAAGSVLAHRTEPMGRRIRDLGRARRLVGELAAAAGPAIRAVPYVDVDLTHGRVSAPRPTVCCRWYRVAADGVFCAGCPREPEPARTEHLREFLMRTVWPVLQQTGAGPEADGTGSC